MQALCGAATDPMAVRFIVAGVIIFGCHEISVAGIARNWADRTLMVLDLPPKVLICARLHQAGTRAIGIRYHRRSLQGKRKHSNLTAGCSCLPVWVADESFQWSIASISPICVTQFVVFVLKGSLVGTAPGLFEPQTVPYSPAL